MRPSDARTHGAGLLLAESLIGISHGLHSRAAALIPLMLQEDILSTSDLRVSAICFYTYWASKCSIHAIPSPCEACLSFVS